MPVCPASTHGRGREKRNFLARLSRSTTRLLVPLSRDFCSALLHSVRFHLKLYGMPRAMASYSMKTLEKVLHRTTTRNGAKAGAVQVVIRASGQTLLLSMRLPGGLIAPARLKSLLPASPPGVRVALKAVKGAPVLTFEAFLPERE